jgi:hypothetical protein
MKVKTNTLNASIALLKTAVNGIVSNGTIKNTYKGYVSAFGGSIVQSGIAPACVAFLGDDNKKKIVEAIYTICKKSFKDSSGNDIYVDTTLSIRQSIPGRDISSPSFRNHMAEAAVALKLAMRTYEFKKD